MTKKSILLSLGAVAAVVTPIAAVVACSADEVQTTSTKHSISTSAVKKTSSDNADEAVTRTVTLTGSYKTISGIQQSPDKITEAKLVMPEVKEFATPEIKDIAETPVAKSEYKAPTPTMSGYAIPTLPEFKAPEAPKTPSFAPISPEAIPTLVGSTKLSPIVIYTQGETITGFDHSTIAIPEAPIAPVMDGYAVPVVAHHGTPVKFATPKMSGYAIPTVAPFAAPTKAPAPTMAGYAVPTVAPFAAPKKAPTPTMSGYAIPTVAPFAAPKKASTPTMAGYAVPTPISYVATFAPREVFTGFEHTTK